MSARTSRHFIQTRSALRDVVRQMRSARRVCLDIEADSLHHYFEKICLIQVYFDGIGAVIDPLAGLDLRSLLRVLAQKPLIVHGGDYDFRMLRLSYDFIPRGTVFDTALAAQLLGYTRLGLAALADRLLGVTLSKGGQKSDWSRRPLTPAQLRYALDDVRYLGAIADRLSQQLAARGRTTWHREACERLVATCATASPRRRRTEEWRIKGLRHMTPRQLAFVREIWHWRDREARRADRPSFRIMSNHNLVELAVWAAAHPAAPLESGPALPRSCCGPRRRSLARAIEHARNLPQSRWPQPRHPECRPEEDPEVRRLIRTLSEARDALAHQLGLAPAMIAPKAALVVIVQKELRTTERILAHTSLLRWQAKLMEPLAEKLFAKKTAHPSHHRPY